jgi:pimeloyl-ACP methyl ester carboxylesterase
MRTASWRAVEAVRTATIEVSGWADDPWPVVVHRADPPEGDAGAPVLWLHGVPTDGRDWVAFLERAGGVAPDLPGFGRSSKRGDGDFTLDGYARFCGALVDALELERVRLVVHDWGAAALAWAAAHPERVERLVVLDAVPLLAGYRWHRVARLWRTRGAGELAMGATTGLVLRRGLPGDVGARAAEGFDQGTQRAILRLYRSAPPERLAQAGRDLGALSGVPSLVVWGERDPYIDPSFAHRYAEALGGAEARIVPGAGHWPWIEQPAVVDDVVAFLGGG